MTILDDIVGQRVLVGETYAYPNFLGTIVEASLSGAQVDCAGVVYSFQWSQVRNFLVSDSPSIGSRVVCLNNYDLIGTVHSISPQWIWVAMDASPHLCKRPSSGFWCTRLAGHSGSCPTYTVGHLFPADPVPWSCFIYRPEGLVDYLSGSPAATLSRTRFDLIFEDI